ncbi:MAG: hypothetical protein MZU95_16870, partial [Desulfomicrobium escambiense]|nr:hypothetical protein [Desulfomicrobium escambiense]
MDRKSELCYYLPCREPSLATSGCHLPGALEAQAAGTGWGAKVDDLAKVIPTPLTHQVGELFGEIYETIKVGILMVKTGRCAMRYD